MLGLSWTGQVFYLGFLNGYPFLLSNVSLEQYGINILLEIQR
jgi:hypothetical protein